MNDLQTKNNAQGLINIEDYAMGIDALVKQAGLIQRAMDAVMKEGEHYGKIPGTDKPVLLKPGAEKLNFMFRLRPEYSIIREERKDDFIAYTTECRLIHYPTDTLIATGLGSCNSRETKYRYRYVYEPTGQSVPKEYWAAKKAGNNKEMKRLLGAEGRPYKTDDGRWVIATSKQVINENPWDLDNTLIKMSCKRSLTAAVLNGTAASDLFTQDLEELLEKEIALATEMAGQESTGPQADDSPTMDEILSLLPPGISRNQFKTFLEESAAFLKKPLGYVLTEAQKNFAATARSFERWTEKKNGKTEQKRRGRPKADAEAPKQEPPPQEPPETKEPSIDDKLVYVKKNFTRSYKKALLLLGHIAHMDDGDAFDPKTLNDEQKNALHTKVNALVDSEKVEY
jgi:hypothetical protein